jgi:hypothetical protein
MNTATPSPAVGEVAVAAVVPWVVCVAYSINCESASPGLFCVFHCVKLSGDVPVNPPWPAELELFTQPTTKQPSTVVAVDPLCEVRAFAVVVLLAVNFESDALMEPDVAAPLADPAAVRMY